MDWLKVIDYAIFIGMDIAKCYDTSELFILLVWPMRSDILIQDKKIFFINNIKLKSRSITAIGFHGGRFK